MTTSRKIAFAAILTAVVALLWLGRYEVHSSGAPAAYVLDRWTGQISWIRYAEIQPVKPYEPTPPQKAVNWDDFTPATPSKPTPPVSIDEFLKSN